jgi:hypothetical protein
VSGNNTIKCEVFLKRAIAKYGDTFNYNIDQYKDFSQHKIDITCKCGKTVHVTPQYHLNKGCPNCSLKVRKTRTDRVTWEDFLKRSFDKYGNQFTYCDEYKNSSIKINIKCNRCQTLLYITPQYHLRRGCSGCRYTYSKDRIKTSLFIERANISHGIGRYDYSNTVCLGSRDKVCIKCNKCGIVFKQISESHLKGHGCNICAMNGRPKSEFKLTKEEFIKKSRSIHGDKFEYIWDYNGIKYIIFIKCIKCDIIWERKAHSHWNSKYGGCNKCLSKGMKDTQRMSIAEYESQCVSVHKGRYLYFQDYEGHGSKIKIYCKKHDYYFYQKASHHRVRLHGCPKCHFSTGELKISNFLDNKNIKYEMGKKFPECKNILPLKFDFYIPFYNLCIEYDGEQHFRPIKYFKGDIRFDNSKKLDEIKNKFCFESNINLLRIPYYDFKNIEIIINNYLNVNYS